MIEFDELKNAQSIMYETYKKFESLTHREIKKNLVDALWIVNHFIQLNDEASNSVEPIARDDIVDPGCPCGKYH